MSSPRKVRPPTDSSDPRELEDLLRSAAKFFQTNKPPLMRQFSTKKSPSSLRNCRALRRYG
jgi:hypothetical protein